VKSVRLLPIVIFSALALLLFKSVGLVTNGSYALTGTTMVEAAGGGGHAPEGGAHGEPAADGAMPSEASMPSEATLADVSPTLDDHAPTLGENSEGGHGGGHGAPAADAHGGTAEAEGDHAADAAAGDHGAGETAAPEAEQVAEAAPTDAAHSESEAAPVVPGLDCPIVDGEAADPACVPADPRAEGVPMRIDAAGNLVPLTGEDGTSLTDKVLLERLAERRTELDSWESELTMRLALVEAAERRLEERSAALEALEARIAALVEEQKSAQEAEVKGLIGMYEAMKPADAAAIFNNLDTGVLLRLARGISPRKMAPIMAKMTEARAQELTALLARADDPAPTEAKAGDLASLPQIVGQ